MQPFTLRQKQNIERGAIVAQLLSDKITDALKQSDVRARAKRHHYIYAPAGVGKSHTVRATAKRHKVGLIEIGGVASMNAIAIRLAVAVYNSAGRDLFVWVDDCDSIFMDRESLSVMKGALDEDRNQFAWNKNMTAMIQRYEKSDVAHDQDVAEALRHFQTPDGVGLLIDTRNVHFIVTSNHPLTPTSQKVKKGRQIDEAAIRDRVVYTQLDVDRDTSWGWTAAVTMQNKIFDISKAQKRILLEWLDLNWDRLASTSIRTVKELAAEMINHPDNYPDYWETHLSN